MEHLNRIGPHQALYVDIETAQTAREDVPRGMRAICGAIGASARGILGEERLFTWLDEALAEQGAAAEALARVWALTRGQPWLVNALAYRTCFEQPEGRDRSRPISAAMIDAAKASLILERVTHLDQLADKLREERVRRVIEPMRAGETLEQLPLEDIEYLTDLGLLRQRDDGGIDVANPIYPTCLGDSGLNLTCMARRHPGR